MASVVPSVRARTFTFVGVDVDPAAGTITCDYRSDDADFRERVRFDATVDLGAPGVREAAELYFLLAGLSYYKTGAADIVAAPSLELGDADLELLAGAIHGGLAEFAHRNGLDLSDVELPSASRLQRAQLDPPVRGPLIPFGGGIDSIVTVETNTVADAALFIVAPASGRFDAIERPAARSAGRRPLDERPRPGDGDRVDARTRRRRRAATLGGGDEQRTVRVVSDPRRGRSARQPPVVQVPRV
jgi:hypothetical protein